MTTKYNILLDITFPLSPSGMKYRGYVGEKFTNEETLEDMALARDELIAAMVAGRVKHVVLHFLTADDGCNIQVPSFSAHPVMTCALGDEVLKQAVITGTIVSIEED